MARKSRIQDNETEDKSRPRKTVFCNFVKVQSLTARFILHLIKEQAQIVVRKVSYCWLREIERTERSNPAAWQHKYKYWKIQIQNCHQTDWEFVWCQEGLKINGAARRMHNSCILWKELQIRQPLRPLRSYRPCNSWTFLFEILFVPQSLESDN